MTREERNRVRRLNRIADEYGFCIRKWRNGGFYFLIISTNAIWSRVGYNLTLDDVEYILTHPDENGYID